jgi:hypothetical protein
MNHRISLALLALTCACAPVAIPAPPQETAEQQQERLDRERYQARIRTVPGAPQAISGFLRIGHVYSERIGSGMTVTQPGNLRDLDTMIDVLNDYTEIDADFTPQMSYADPLLMDLPIIVPQGEPTEAELEALTRYLLSGGFVLNTGLDREVFREGLEKYGGLVWGQDAWHEVLQADHPLFSAFFAVGNVRPTSIDNQRRPNGLFIGERLAVFDFQALGQRDVQVNERDILRPDDDEDLSPTALRQREALLEGAVGAQRELLRDVRFEQMVVNAVVYALTQPGSIAQRDAGGM